ncbi:trans-sulfuration enzyme family protein [Catenuloplanes atrovinosus]|uniref:homocysteine desulfhydrase n=1 Tax=Catenuloplanes atrovinosus TaxID=137266 RepID=A0AAE4CEK1_9ACTN|nr:aminotransferase class I/II-fold pyridoxal phosphate-dependent enzyme [Catenuloplanes atrovinosus]MDR7278715.1 methionine-gamma-lyase [Catenuloplanes atrovinosus]
MRPETRAVHPRRPEPTGSTPITTPLYQTSTWIFDDPDVLADAFHTPTGPFLYSRMTNPTVRVLETAVADLEGGAAGLATSSGMGAINLVLQASLRGGDHVVAQRRLYGGAAATLRDLGERFGVEVDYLDQATPEALRDALRPGRTKVVYLETISNPTGYVADLPALTAAARAAGAVTVVDNTFATPLLCRPIAHGADIVVHSLTKYLAGHHDVVGGIAVFAETARYESVWHHGVEFGVAADPFSAWLTVRSLQTLALRMERHCANAAVVAARLAAHPAVERVHYPGLAAHPTHEIARRLLTGGYGGTFAFDLAGGRSAGTAVSKRLRLVELAPSLGGTGTTLMHPASTSHRQLDEAQLAAVGIGEGTIRISVGIEHVEDVWSDLEQALA